MARLHIGIEPAKLVHKGTIDGQLPQSATGVFAEPTVTAGKAVFGPALVHGGFFRFNTRNLIVEGYSGGTPTIVDDLGTVIRPLPTVTPFTLHPGEGMLFNGGTECMILVRENATRII